MDGIARSCVFRNGECCSSFIRAVYDDIAFICTDLELTPFKQQIVAVAENVYLIADSTKIGDTSFANLGRISLVDALICDSNLSEDVKSKLKDMNVKII